MSTAYAIVYRDPHSVDGSGVRVRQVLWSEAEAVATVERLNALATDGSQPYFCQATWVASREAEHEPSLTPEDREYLSLAERHGIVDTEQPTGVFFSFLFNREGARAAVEELRSLGWPEAGLTEESSGDDCWHVYAHRFRLVLNDDSIRRLRGQLEELAERHGGKFDGWDVSGGRGLRWSKPGDLSP